jgi:hypothetical protein
LTLLFGAGNAGVHTLEDALTFELGDVPVAVEI